ncbi:chaperone modulator CbpM [Dyadobacter sp. CY343]|uniref:chaperone modulator CbpM n=1 Tax=Dyadobacter sp. CY343 TaxID=2907299 RepID=UPI001F2134B8|nr:chaperone modulator CbpM [Dyadobacter sp. CY343]MCE7060277.1 chaperone modulator CbpM [Dyadobacter sp. CY343]
MENDQLIAIDTFCTYYEVEYSFVESLQNSDLIELVEVNESRFLQIPQLRKIERLIRLHRDLDINIAGIEAVDNLLNRVDNLSREILTLKNRLRFYERDL